MNAQEAFAICRIAKGAFPATNFDEYTPDSWAMALEDTRFEDAREALKQLMREQTFIHVSEIIDRVKRIRRDRILEFGPFEVPSGLEPAEYHAFITKTHRGIADGTIRSHDDLGLPKLEPATNRPAIEFDKVFRSIPEEDE
jgi:hypothetical protein